MTALWLTVATLAAQSPLDGHWRGVMVRESDTLAMSLDFETGAGGHRGTFSAPRQRALGIPLDTVRFSAPSLHVVLDGTIIFDGQASGDIIRGTFSDGDGNGTFALRRETAPRAPYRSEEVHFSNRDAVLSGTAFLPRGSGPYPAVVFNHGSGPEGRFASRFYADYVARRGIAALIYDKRGVGQSTGDWQRATFQDLADDAIAGVHRMQRFPTIDRRLVGIYGHSQGGTIAPLIATRSPDVAFAIAAAAIGMPVYLQDLFRTRNDLTAAGLGSANLEQAMAFYGLWLEVARTGRGWERLDAALPAARLQSWFAEVEPPPRDNWLWSFYRQIGDYDGIAFWERVRVPVLLVYGERDRNTPVTESVRNIERALDRSGTSDYTMLMLPRAAHNLTVRAEPGEPFQFWHVAPGYPDLLATWIRGLVGRDRHLTAK